MRRMRDWVLRLGVVAEVVIGLGWVGRILETRPNETRYWLAIVSVRVGAVIGCWLWWELSRKSWWPLGLVGTAWGLTALGAGIRILQGGKPNPVMAVFAGAMFGGLAVLAVQGAMERLRQRTEQPAQQAR